jgi:hypothetical protein
MRRLGCDSDPHPAGGMPVLELGCLHLDLPSRFFSFCPILGVGTTVTNSLSSYSPSVSRLRPGSRSRTGERIRAGPPGTATQPTLAVTQSRGITIQVAGIPGAGGLRLIRVVMIDAHLSHVAYGTVCASHGTYPRRIISGRIHPGPSYVSLPGPTPCAWCTSPAMSRAPARDGARAPS